MLTDDQEESINLISIIENLSTSPSDTDKLVQDESFESRPIGMDNFRKKYKSPKKTSPINILNNTSQYLSPARERWKTALKKLRKIEDPWAKFKIADYPQEVVIRHRYNPVKNEWKKDENTVKMELKQFANGAMRACFRLKKLSNFSHDTCWDHASNYVAKSYKDPEIPRKRYFEDVKLQMDAKLWAELYNRHNPPKKIDMFQVAIIEFKNRENSPLFHLEHYIEGEYIKYNSNAGFVEDLHLRLTPHAFSHFTFESSNHELIVVDIQGVGDLYTDPQIHTAFGNEYGEGNLNIKGFALFFYSHVCNDVCKSLGLTPFDLAPSELKNHHKIVDIFSKTSDTKSFGRKVEPINELLEFEKKKQIIKQFESYDSTNSVDIMEVDEENYNSCSSMSPYSSSFSQFYLNRENSNSSRRTDSYTNDIFDERLEDEALKYINSKAYNKHRPSAAGADKLNLLNAETEYRKKIQEYSTFDSVLGKIHIEMCKYHEVGRFLDENDDNSTIDYEAAFFHLQQAADLGEIEALVNIAKVYMQLPHDILSDYQVKDSIENFHIGFDYLLEAAEKDDKQSLYYAARAYDSGIGLPDNIPIDWSKAMEYYRKILNEPSEDDSLESSFNELGNNCEAVYVILARIGEIYLTGGNGVELNLQEAYDFFNEAAEKAMQYGKGRLANKYYSLAEKASALL